MRCNPLRWLVGSVLVLGLLGVMNMQGVLAQIEAELAQEARQSLAQAGLDWAEVEFSGRDSKLLGIAPDENERRKAYQITSSLWGVRKVSNRTDLIAEEKNYVWRAQLRDDRLKLTGFVPNEQTRRAIIGAAKATFPQLEVQDRMKLARGAPDTEIWLGAVSFSLKQLSRLKPGAAVQLEFDGLEIVGEAEDSAAFRSIKSALATGLPQGIALKQDRVKPPVVDPYIWAARLSGTQLQLGGYVPSEDAREEVFAAAQEAFPKAVIVDRMRIAAGEPDGLVSAAVGALGKLAQLEQGDIEIKGKELLISGLATKEETANFLRETLREGIPKSIKVDEKIKFREPAIKPVSPYTIGAAIDNDKLLLTGYVPSEAARAELVKAAKSYFPKLDISDGLKLGANAPDGWQTCMTSGMASLVKLGNGRIEMVDNKLIFAGVTEDEQVAEAVRNELRAAVNRACELNARLVVDTPPEPDLSWRASFAEKQVVLEGDVPDEKTKEELQQAAAKLFPEAHIVSRMEIKAARSEKWAKVSDTGLRLLARLRGGEVRILGNELSIVGQAPDAAVVTLIQQQLKDLPSGYRGIDSIEVRSDAMIWAEQEAKRKAEAEARRKAEEDAKLKAEEEARKAEEERLAAEAERLRQEENLRKAEEQARAAAAAEEARLAAEAERLRQEESLRKAEEQARAAAAAEEAAAAAEAQKKAEAEARAHAEEEARRRAEADAAADQHTPGSDDTDAKQASAAKPESEEVARAVQQPPSDAAAEQHAAVAPEHLEADRRCQRAIANATLHGTVNFARASAKLNATGKETLSRLLEVARSCPNVRIHIEGHTDAEGSPEGNQVLSEERAKAAVDYLVSRGVPIEKISAVGYGATRPVAANDTPESRAMNRRVEILIIE